MTTTDIVRPVRLVLTVEEAAECLGIGRTLMYALIASGDVESVRIGRLRRVPADALNAFVFRLRHQRPTDGGVRDPGQAFT
jgi:excisionase family DNA binding protein